MNFLSKIILFSLLSSGATFSIAMNAQANNVHAPAASSEPLSSEKEELINTKGIVTQIDTGTKKVTITHEPIPSVNWPAMTMRFTYEEPAMIENIKTGSHVVFDFVQQGNISQLKHIALIN